ncbi:MAG: glycoside hydrolase family 9 protein [Prevotella sp.]|nr:glycoside hydrolase family 9 protein [Prevotella sp.]
MRKLTHTFIGTLCCLSASAQTPPVANVAQASLKAFYLIRSGVPVEPEYAGEYARPQGHADTQVLIHPSAASPARPAGSVISSPLGWYDAGDYNKYVVNSAYSCGLMLLAYEQLPEYFQSHSVNIPESGNRTADVLDETMFNLKWLLTMQDPSDGGVYHKLTTPNFEGFVMPADCHQQRYVVQKSVTAAYDFAAVMAQAARIFKDNPDYPGFSTKAEKAAESAYRWAKSHPEARYDQQQMNRQSDPDINTGEYGDRHADDEQYWAASELFILCKKKQYYDDAIKVEPADMQVPSWGSVAALGQLEWLIHGKKLMKEKAARQLARLAKELARRAKESPIGASFGQPSDYGWGCLADCCMQGYLLLMADRYLPADETVGYRTIALANMQFILGNNPTGYCFVTAIGKKPAMHPHHRISAADGIEKPVPGLLVGGPNPGQQDREAGRLTYPSKEPALSYLDVEESYASNEIAINWQASLVALSAWADCLTSTAR